MQISFNCISEDELKEDYLKTSLLFYSEDEIASISVGNVTLYLMVRGETRIKYKGEIYNNYGQFSQELKDLLRSNKDWFENEDFELIDNNWYNLEFYVNGEFLFDDCEEIDITENSNVSLSTQMYSGMLDLLKYWAKESLGQYGEEIDNELKMIM